MGVAAGMFAMVLPIPGQTIIALALAAFVGGNKAVCIPVVWISNPFTALPILGTALAIGRAVLPTKIDPADEEQVRQLAALDWNLFSASFWKQVSQIAVNIGAEIWIGCVILGLLLAALSYFPARWAVVKHRERRRLRSHKRHLFRAEARRSKLRRATEAA